MSIADREKNEKPSEIFYDTVDYKKILILLLSYFVVL